MILQKISHKQAYEYVSKMGILGIALEGFLYNNPDVEDVYSTIDLDGLLIFKDDFTLLHSLNEEFLSCAYDFVGENAFFNCVDFKTASFLQNNLGAFNISYCHIY
ncbi:MAG: hypothetical protein IKV38_04025, partial [Clostridia bacterium]|nr:hypothetical protein [Clostridia bacterium]